MVNTNIQMIKYGIFIVGIPRTGYGDRTVGLGVATEKRGNKTGMMIRGCFNQPGELTLGTRDLHPSPAL